MVAGVDDAASDGMSGVFWVGAAFGVVCIFGVSESGDGFGVWGELDCVPLECEATDAVGFCV